MSRVKRGHQCQDASGRGYVCLLVDRGLTPTQLLNRGKEVGYGNCDSLKERRATYTKVLQQRTL